ncbi:NVEALA domain-containing protein, partial [Bacteroides heparinolyticus]
MSKKIFAILIVAVVAVFAGYNVYQSQKGEMMSDLMLANVE